MELKGYFVEEGTTKHDLRKSVERWMSNGWVLVGGVAVALGPNGKFVYFQALAKAQ